MSVVVTFPSAWIMTEADILQDIINVMLLCSYHPQKGFNHFHRHDIAMAVGGVEHRSDLFLVLVLMQ